MDAGWPNWNVDSDRVAVILGNAIGGDKTYVSSLRIADAGNPALHGAAPAP
jgi:hypothetical protein